MKHLHALIIAGGSGTRFWPLSRQSLPKQFLPFAGEHSLLRATWQRLDGLIENEQRWVVAGESQKHLLQRDLPELGARALLEPLAKNTAPAIAFAVNEIRRIDPEAIVVVLPADHFVRDRAAFQNALRAAANAAAESGIVTLGIKAIRPDTGFGYIERGPLLSKDPGATPLYQVARFIEKPPAADAQRYVASGNYYWNGGIFVFRASLFGQLLAELAPAIARPLTAHAEGRATLADAYAEVPSISIDYALIEKAPLVKVVTLDCGWSDVGSWDALADVNPQDPAGNTLIGNTLTIDAKNNIVHNNLMQGDQGKKICLVGVSDLVVVETKDALLIMKHGEAQRVREVVAALKEVAPELL